MTKKTINDVLSIMIEKSTEEIVPKVNGFARYIGKSGGILVRAFGEADIEKQKLLLRRFPDIDQIWKMCSNNIKDGYCRVVAGAYLMGLSSSEIEIGCKELNIWKE